MTYSRYLALNRRFTIRSCASVRRSNSATRSNKLAPVDPRRPGLRSSTPQSRSPFRIAAGEYAPLGWCEARGYQPVSIAIRRNVNPDSYNVAHCWTNRGILAPPTFRAMRRGGMYRLNGGTIS